MTKRDDTVKEVVEQGKDLVHKVNTRHVIIRKADGEKLVDVTMGVAIVAALLLLWFQPIGIFVGLAAVGYGLYKKLRLEVVRELSSKDTVIEMRLPDDEQ